MMMMMMLLLLRRPLFCHHFAMFGHTLYAIGTRKTGKISGLLLTGLPELFADLLKTTQEQNPLKVVTGVVAVAVVAVGFFRSYPQH